MEYTALKFFLVEFIVIMGDFPNDLNITVRNEHFFGDDLTVIINNEPAPASSKSVSENLTSEDEMEITDNRTVQRNTYPTSALSPLLWEQSLSDSDTLSVYSLSDEQYSDSNSKPLFISDGIVGDLNSPDIHCKTFPGLSCKSILKKVEKSCDLNRDIWLSIGNFLPLLSFTPSAVFKDLSKRIVYRKTMLKSFRSSVTSFEKAVKSKGGRIFLIEVFPSPRVLDPNLAMVSTTHHKLSWKVYLGLKYMVNDLNREFGQSRTLNFDPVLKEKVRFRKGRIAQFDKCVIEVSSEEEGEDSVRDKHPERKLKSGLHDSDGIYLLESTRLVVADNISRAINCQKK